MLETNGRRLVTVLLLWVMLLQTFSRVYIIADFYARRDLIASTLCVNKDNPVLNCCGKCQLKKRLDREGKENDLPDGRSIGRYESLSSRSFYLTAFVHYRLVSTHSYPSLVCAATVDRPADYFHPPDRLSCFC